MSYSIIIPVYNEVNHIPKLLNLLKTYSEYGHEIVIVDDGSNDGSKQILLKCDFIKLFCLDSNNGKGIALKKGIEISINEKLIIFDADLELHPKTISALMILDREININCVFANRTNILKNKIIWGIGNKIFTAIFNLINGTKVKDSLCCAKSFYKTDLNFNELKSLKFDIDVELSMKLVAVHKKIKNIDIPYKRRSKSEGKKLNFKDSFRILSRILLDI